MKLSGPNPQSSFSLSLTLASNPHHPSPGPTPLFSTIIPCRSRHCQSKEPKKRKTRGVVCMCSCVYIRIYFAYSTSECVHMSERISACIHEPQTPCLSMYGYAGCCKVGVGWGISIVLQTI